MIFHGSANETASGWRGNLEQVSIHRSWFPAENAHHEALVQSMEGWWNGRGAGVRAVALPDVISDALVTVAKDNPPRPNESAERLLDDTVNPVALLANLLSFMPEGEALRSARKNAEFEGARISARLSISQLVERAWRQNEQLPD